MSLPIAHFTAMFAESDDPWAFRTRFYEQRKRALTVAALDRPSYRRLFEPGCANGELSAELASRAREMLVTDAVPAAVALASARLAKHPHVRVERAVVPREWPDGRFDCIVLSELGYFLSRADLDVLFERATRSLAEDGTLLLCHWRRPIEGCDSTGDEVHAALARTTTLHRLSTHVEEDFLLDVWTQRAGSVGAREGLR